MRTQFVSTLNSDHNPDLAVTTDIQDLEYLLYVSGCMKARKGQREMHYERLIGPCYRAARL